MKINMRLHSRAGTETTETGEQNSLFWESLTSLNSLSRILTFNAAILFAWNAKNLCHFVHLIIL